MPKARPYTFPVLFFQIWLKRRLFVLPALLFFICSNPARAAYVFEFNSETVTAYHYALSLQLDRAAEWSYKAKQKNAENLAPHFVDNYIDFLQLYFDENPETYKKLRPNYSKRIALVERGPSNSPVTLFAQAIIHLQWAAIKIKFGDRVSAGFAFREAFKLSMQNQTRHPDFTPNLMLTGAMEMAAGTIPQNLKWIASIMGISGNLSSGKAKVEAFLNASDAWARLFRNEGVFYYIYLQYYLLNQPDDALKLIDQKRLDLVNNFVFTYMAANLNMNNQQSSKAQKIIQNRNKSTTYFDTPVWDFQMAYCKLYELSPAAETYFSRYHNQYKGSTYLKDSWLKRSWLHLILGNQKMYDYCIKQVKTRGNTNTEADKTAYREVAEGKVPNVTLLKARLLNDGGYHSKALNLLQSVSISSFTLPEQQLEYTYRLGRVYDDLGKGNEAIAAYQDAYLLGKSRPEYYAARASLQIGLIFEKRGDKQKAKQYFQQCINLRGHDYEDSLEQKAKAGIARCNT